MPSKITFTDNVVINCGTVFSMPSNSQTEIVGSGNTITNTGKVFDIHEPAILGRLGLKPETPDVHVQELLSGIRAIRDEPYEKKAAYISRSSAFGWIKDGVTLAEFANKVLDVVKSLGDHIG